MKVFAVFVLALALVVAAVFAAEEQDAAKQKRAVVSAYGYPGYAGYGAYGGYGYPYVGGYGGYGAYPYGYSGLGGYPYAGYPYY
ncbi:spore coat protein YeeK-like [Periplaneta americana]|uniref:spore coat protein YeeK-like n=1 Tax=Periplaneta americana TaxID=6978 RepID=UPI0037E7013B